MIYSERRLVGLLHGGLQGNAGKQRSLRHLDLKKSDIDPEHCGSNVRIFRSSQGDGRRKRARKIAVHRCARGKVTWIDPNDASEICEAYREICFCGTELTPPRR